MEQNSDFGARAQWSDPGKGVIDLTNPGVAAATPVRETNTSANREMDQGSAAAAALVDHPPADIDPMSAPLVDAADLPPQRSTAFSIGPGDAPPSSPQSAIVGPGTTGARKASAGTAPVPARTLRHEMAHSWRRLAVVVTLLIGLVLLASGVAMLSVLGAVFLAGVLYLGRRLSCWVDMDEHGWSVVHFGFARSFEFDEVEEFTARKGPFGTQALALMKSGGSVRVGALEPFGHPLARALGHSTEVRSWRSMEDGLSGLERRRRLQRSAR